MSDDKGTSSDENVHNVMIYQSMSGDADVGTSMFSMAGGQLISNNGDMLYITNTHCILTLDNVLLSNLDEDGTLMTITGNSASHGWGTAGSNGASAEVTVSDSDSGRQHHRRYHFFPESDSVREQHLHRHHQYC